MTRLARLVTTSVCAAGLLGAGPAGAQTRTGGYPDPRGAPAPDARYSAQPSQYPRGRGPHDTRSPRTYPPRGRARADRFWTAAYDNGFGDGYRRGLDDGRDGDRYDPLRDRRYRSADRGYQRWYGDRPRYKNVYRDGFRAGYEEGYRDGRRDRRSRRSDRGRWSWPF
jgi:hypothetical protein